MKIIHLVDPRIGPNNAGTPNCIMCGAVIFNDDGTTAYDSETTNHTTDPVTYAAPEEVDCTACTA